MYRRFYTFEVTCLMGNYTSKITSHDNKIGCIVTQSLLTMCPNTPLDTTSFVLDSMLQSRIKNPTPVKIVIIDVKNHSEGKNSGRL